VCCLQEHPGTTGSTGPTTPEQRTLSVTSADAIDMFGGVIFTSFGCGDPWLGQQPSVLAERRWYRPVPPDAVQFRSR